MRVLFSRHKHRIRRQLYQLLDWEFLAAVRILVYEMPSRIFRITGHHSITALGGNRTWQPDFKQHEHVVARHNHFSRKA
jgi:hypothetical protein